MHKITKHQTDGTKCPRCGRDLIPNLVEGTTARLEFIRNVTVKAVMCTNPYCGFNATSVRIYEPGYLNETIFVED